MRVVALRPDLGTVTGDPGACAAPGVADTLLSTLRPRVRVFDRIIRVIASALNGETIKGVLN